MHSAKKIGLLACRPEALTHLSAPLEAQGWQVVGSRLLTDDVSATADLSAAEVLVVDLDGAENQQLERLNELVSRETRPVLFNDSSQDAGWVKRLHAKLCQLLGVDAGLIPASVQSVVEAVAPAVAMAVAADIESARDEAPALGGAAPCRNVWVLSASLGGPRALREFFGELADDLPAALILLQRIGGEHLDMLINYLHRYTRYPVTAIDDSVQLRHGQIFLAPVEEQFFMIDGETLRFNGETDPEHVLDNVLEVVAKRYKTRAGTIIFSAMGGDGIEGCEYILGNGGQVWLQHTVGGQLGRFITEGRHAPGHTLIAPAVELARRLNAYLGSLQEQAVPVAP